MDIIDGILQGDDLYVVLESRRGRKYIESYNLSTILVHGNKFWAKFKNNHAPIGHEHINPLHSISYIYNNFCDVVCTMSLSMGVQRFCSSNSYSKLDFFVKGSYDRIWDNTNQGDVKLMEELVRCAAPMKVIIKAKDGFTYIIPAHTVEVYDDDRSFAIDTEYDGFPCRIKDLNSIDVLDKKLKEVTRISPLESHAGTKYQHDKPFFLTSFMISENSICQREIDDGGNLVNKIFEFYSVEVLAETIR